MPLNVFFTLCILGIDFMVYVLFQWTYGDKRRAITRKIAAIRNSPEQPQAHPFLVASKRPPLLNHSLSTPSQRDTSRTARFLQST